MRSKLLIITASSLGVILLLAVSILWFVRSGRLDLWLQRQIVEAFKDVGVRAEIGDTRLDVRGYSVTLEDIKLYAGEGERPFASIEKLVAEFSVLDYLRRKINITEINVSRPDLWIEVDEQGRTNVEALHAPPERDAEEAGINFLTAHVRVENGKLTLVDRNRDISAELIDINSSFIPREAAALENRINHLLEISLGGAKAGYQGRTVENISSNLRAVVTLDRTQVEEFKFDSDAGRLTATGEIPSYSPLKYNFDVQSDIVVDELGRVIAPEMRAEGAANINARVEGTGTEYRVTGDLSSPGVSAEGLRLDDVRVSRLSVEGTGARYQATANITAASIRGEGFSLSSINLGGATISGQKADFDVTSALNIDSLRGGQVAVSRVRARLQADQERVTLSDLTASTLGGSVAGDVTLAYGGGQSRVDVRFRALNLNQIASVVAEENASVRGTASGSAEITFPGLNFGVATGAINATFDAAVLPPRPGADSFPATGRISMLATGGGFNVREAFVKTPTSEVNASGTIGSSGRASLGVNLVSQDMAEVFRAIEAFGLIPEDAQEEYQMGLSGPGQFTGRVEGDLSSPSVSGHLELENIVLRDEAIGRFTGDIAFSPSRFSIERASLVAPDNSRADFTLGGSTTGRDDISVRANVQSFDLDTLVRLAAPDLAGLVGGGKVTGTLDLGGLPGPRGIEGTANIQISDVQFEAPATEEGKETENISVPSLTGEVRIEDSVLNIQNLRAEVGGSTISGQGTFNLDTYAFSVDAQGQGIDLARISEALPGNVSLTGQADVTVTGRGMWDEWSNTNLNATIQGRDVLLNGRDLGDARIEALTEGSTLKVQATGNVLDESRTLTATIDLADRRNYPISASIELNDEDIGPYLSLISPRMESLSARATGTIRLSGPLQNPDEIQILAELSSLTIGGAVAGGQSYSITNQGTVRISATPQEVNISPVTFVGEGTTLSLAGLVSRDGARSSLTIEGDVNLRLINSFTTSIFATGVAGVQAAISGSLESPRLLGTVDLKEVGLRVLEFPLSINRGNGQIRFTSNQALIENFSASAPGGGSIRLSGGAALEGLVPERWQVDIDADQVGVEYPLDAFTTFDADLTYRGNPEIQVLSGNVDVRRASYTRDITIEELIRTGGPFGSDFFGAGSVGGPGTGPRMTLDIDITADETLIVRNNIINARGSADLDLRGPASDPQISGRVLLSRGTIELRNGRHELTRGLITFPGGRRSEPILDFETQAEISGYRITIGFEGPPSRLQTTLRSDPDLPDSDIISLALTGNLAGGGPNTTAAATQTGLGLAQSLLGAALTERFERGTQRLFGLSRFSIDPLLVGRGSDPTARVTIGKRVSRDLTLTYSQNLTSGPSGLDRIVLVEYRISNRFSVVGFRNERGELGFDVRFQKRF
jgi:translocation and assembly module TamB